MTPNIAFIFDRFNGGIQILFEKKWGTAKLAIGIFLFFSFIYFPEIIYKRVSADWTTTDKIVQTFVNDKIKAPFTPYLNAEKWDHFRKRDLRITPYLVGITLHFESIKLFYLQALLLFPLFIYLSLKSFHSLTHDPITTFWATLALLFCYVGNSFPYDTFFYDSFAYIGLLAAFYWRKNILVIPILLATFFVDERSIIPAGLILILDKLTAEPAELSMIYQLKSLTINNAFLGKFLLACIAYLAIRVYLYNNYQLATPIGNDSGVSLGLAFIHKFKVPFAIFSAFKLNYILIVLALTKLLRSKAWIFSIAFSTAILLIFITSTAVEDVTRSLAYGFLLIFAYYKMLPNDSAEIKQVRVLCALIALGNLLLPTYSLLLNLYQIPILTWIKLF
jgi:hypothetical protein